MSGEASDDALIAAARRGDQQAFTALIRRYQQLVYAVSLRLLRDRDLAEDVTQETFLRAFQSLDRFRGGSVRAWLLRIAHNAALDQLRAARRHLRVPLESKVEEAESEMLVAGFSEHAGLFAALEDALAALPPEQRAVILLADVEGLPYEEVAESLNIPIGTVKSRLARARVRLRALLLADPRARELLELSGRLPGEGHDPTGERDRR